MASAISAIHQQAQNVTAYADSSSSSTSDAGTISASDFLTLLVTELQNQDPTTASDPTAYINQLVNVNSLEQLVSINQTVTKALGSSSSTSSEAKETTVADALPASSPAVRQEGGNLSVPQASASAITVAQSLSGKHTAR